MQFDESTYEQIENFLKGALSPEEMQSVRRRIENDPAFAAEVEWIRDFIGMMSDQKANKVLLSFQQIHRERKRTQKKRRQLLYFIAGLAATLLLVIGFFFLPIAPTEEEPSAPLTTAPSDEASWKAFVEIEPGQQHLGSAEDSLLDRALILIDNERNLEAIPLLETYLASLPEGEFDFDRRILLGKIYLKDTEDYSKAAFHFNLIAQNEDALPRYRNEARFYLALTDLANGDQVAAEAALREIAGQNLPVWSDRATEILENF